ncbi:carboxypeptidase regulatory-like domain-containing protein [Fibrobacter sp. UWB12]|uniref:carboxypeptidase regulatory-like domain-containing protein n=1 Tax=Fibrobacter sp. UWB12 TaxID=1896203 RepID=UPI00091FA4FB|nr:carboxypeptidase regulatory-like domain-containing protein [Fibrobacter sp. UWB12]SHK98309.1 Por secretion system C-terminal sorting domain-containing protein [Fibrobacter sp. UWB12]
MKKAILSVFSIILASSFSAASAYTLSGTVKSESGSPISGASVRLAIAGDSTSTDNDGKFKIEKKDSTISISKAGFTPGYISYENGTLHFAQSSNSPVQVSIFDMAGHQVLSQTLHGTGQVHLRDGVKAEGSYIARIRVGSAQQAIKFSTEGSFNRSYSAQQGGALLKVEDDSKDTLIVTANDYDTLRVYLSKLDTALELTLKKPVIEQTHSFGYAMGNEPTPSKGCGKDNTLKDYFKFTGGGIEHEIYLTMPENYDKNKPYRLVFGMHYMGGSAEVVAKKENYYGFRNQPGAKENTIFVAPHGYTDENGRENPWRCNDNKDHLFFDEFLTYLNENLCIDTSRVFSIGFSFGAMFSNALAQDFQHRLRGVVVFSTMDQVIYMPKNAGKPIAWMGTVGMEDNLCTPKLGRSARDRILKNNGIPDENGEFTDARGETAEEYSGSGNHVCYDYKTVDPRFPVKWCTFKGEHTYNPREDGKIWTIETGWEFITQF